ncbi:MAG TPA: hypothetical protein VK559_03560 [Ferruginibacter sp.]|nr:hypothetical protein [Ferruginibacter sp.]
MSQDVQYISIKNLILWTENPRDPIDIYAKDQDVVDRAFDDKSSKWSLAKLAKEMGDYYDFSELPTVVYHGKKPVVYDGNRRVILGKIKHGYVTSNDHVLRLPDIPNEIPCNVCSKDIALKNILRKHGDSGSWLPLERDIFLNKYLKEPKSPFLIIEECTGLISSQPHLNQRFVKDEIFREDILEQIGFEIKSDKLCSVHSDKQAYSILSDISNKVENRKITTRLNRGKVIDVLERKTQQLIDQNKENKLNQSNITFRRNVVEEPDEIKLRQAKRKQKKEQELFGGKLYLNIGNVSDLYRDIADLYQYYITNKNILSQSFPSLIRMGLRLLCETAAKDHKQSLDKFIQVHFSNAKKNLEQDTKTTLANQNVSEGSIIQLLHTGAHNYQSASNIDQTIAISIIIGEILKLSHGQEI